WHGATIVARQRNLHVGAACALAALSVALLPTQYPVWRAVVASAAIIVLVLAVAATATEAVDREHQLDHSGSSSRSNFRTVALAGALVLVTTALSSCWTVDQAVQPGLAPAMASTTRAILAVQVVLL